MHRSTSVEEARLLARLDRLPVMTIHYGWALLLAANVMLEYYDNAIFAYASPTVKIAAQLSTAQIGAISSALFVGMVIGGLTGGRIADRFGRRSVLVGMTIVYSLGALATAFAPSFETILASRVVTGFGGQAATSVILVYIAEMFPAKSRGRFLSVATFGFVVSAIGAAALAMLYLPSAGPDGWRHLFLIGGVGLLVAPFIWFTLPESARWYVSVGKLDRASVIIGKLESRALHLGPLDEPKSMPKGAGANIVSLSELLRNKSLVRVLLVVGVGYFGSMLGYYLFANWGVYSLVHGLQYPIDKAYQIQFMWNAIYCVTPLLTYLFLDRVERKTTIFAISLFSAAPLLALGISTSSWVVVSAGGVAAISTAVVVSAYYTYIPEAIPTQFRALGSGILLACGRVGGALSGVIGAALFDQAGMAGVMLAGAACYVLFAVPVAVFGPFTTNRALEDVDIAERPVGSAQAERAVT